MGEGRVSGGEKVVSILARTGSGTKKTRGVLRLKLPAGYIIPPHRANRQNGQAPGNVLEIPFPYFFPAFISFKISSIHESARIAEGQPTVVMARRAAWYIFSSLIPASLALRTCE